MRRQKRGSRAILLAAAMVGLGNFGCMGFPWGNSLYEDHTAPVTFIGGQISPGEHVDIQACTNIYYDAADGLWMKCAGGETIASATANTASDYLDSKGVNWYGWSVPVVIPERYWTSICAFSNVNKKCTLVRSIGATGPNWIYWNGDYTKCPDARGTAQLNNRQYCAYDSHHQDGWIIVNTKK